MEHLIEKKGVAFTRTNLQGTGAGSSVRSKSAGRLLCSIAGGAGVLGGVASLIAGLICVAIHTLIASDSMFDHVGTALLIGAIPAILIGSIFLDDIRPGR